MKLFGPQKAKIAVQKKLQALACKRGSSTYKIGPQAYLVANLSISKGTPLECEKHCN